jgi:uncharacterized iron-regulated protein
MIVRNPICRLARPALAAACAALAACAGPGPAPRDELSSAQGRLVLGRPLADFYDSVFVLTEAGATVPRAVSVAGLADRLLGYDVIFFGEFHRHPGVHLQQQRLLRALHERAPALILSFEQFERDVQPVLDDYLAGRIGEITLTEQGRAWDSYRPSYRPLLEYAKVNGLPVVAAEAPAWAIGCIGQWGPEILAQFTPAERATVASELHLGPGAYRDKYMRFQSGSASHGGGAAPSPQALLRAERSYASQAARDDSMAESIQRALRQHPGSKLLHLNGSFHSAGFLGTVERLRLRDPGLKIAVIQPVEAADPQEPAISSAALAEGTALLLVYPNPPDFVEGEDQSDFIRRIIAQRAAKPCKYTPPSAAPAAPAASAAS